MNKTALIVFIIIVILVVSGAGYYFYTKGQPAYQAPAPNTTGIVPNPNPPANNTQTQQPAQPEVLSASISIQNFAFTPATLNIKVGTTVTWTNNDPFPHQIKSDSFNSSSLTTGGTFQFTFSNTGTYNYSCAIHPSMRGQINVTQ